MSVLGNTLADLPVNDSAQPQEYAKMPSQLQPEDVKRRISNLKVANKCTIEDGNVGLNYILEERRVDGLNRSLQTLIRPNRLCWESLSESGSKVDKKYNRSGSGNANITYGSAGCMIVLTNHKKLTRKVGLLREATLLAIWALERAAKEKRWRRNIKNTWHQPLLL